ncbi:triose-phosphate isomerase [Altibacter sp.]|uniref:triose-phosphate isomerase n=1 Tax=Altibacter sp. TaxID=2024823 RepID=UPI00258BA79B|nr:triose-phosphate isomerase [Altibacter sp.]MCW9037433.1 triose-phosphate isomerase [Altibacter sp.]
MRKRIVAGNWKMNNDLAETEVLLQELKKQVIPEKVSVLVAPSFTNLQHAFESLRDHPIAVAAQTMHQSDHGAFTGEVSAAMLKSVGVKTVILGHSERRAYFGEDNALLAEKVTSALRHEMTVIFCIGETLQERKQGHHVEVVTAQLEEGLFHISENHWQHIVLAYEPVWAIGTGETASPEQAQEMHKEIRNIVASSYSESIADKVSILYGGSVKPENAKEIFGQPDVDGGLIGGASLNARSFMEIVSAFL